MIPVVLLTFWLGARGLNADSLWWDEYYSVYDSGGSVFGPLTPAEIWTRVENRNPWHTPGYFIALSGWERLAGSTALALRGFSLLAGIVALAWTYRLGRDLASARVGLFAAAILGSSAFFIHYLHELRMYSLFALFAAFTLRAYLRVVDPRRRPTALAWIGLLAGAVGMLYTHYFAALPLGAIGLYHLLFARKDRRWWGVVGVMALAGIAFLPWFGVLLAGLHKAAGDERLQGNFIGLGETVNRVVTLFGNGSPMLFVALIVVLGGAALIARRRGAPKLWFFTVALFVTVVLANAVSHVMLEGRGRYLIGLWPLLALIGALGLTQLGRWTSRQIALAALALWMAFGVYAALSNAITAQLDGGTEVYPIFQVAEGLRELAAQPGDTVINDLPDGLEAWRFGGVNNYYFWGMGMDFRTIEGRSPPAAQAEEHAALMTTLKDKQRVWLAEMPANPPSALGDLQAALADEFALCTTRQRRAIALSLYARTPVCCWTGDSNASPLIRFDGGIDLMGVATLPPTVETTLPVEVGWQLDSHVPPNTYSASFHVVDAAGKLAAQTDYGLVQQTFDCHPAQIDVSRLAPGQYTLEVIVYAWESGARLNGTVVADGARGDRLPVGTFEVAR